MAFALYLGTFLCSILPSKSIVPYGKEINQAILDPESNIHLEKLPYNRIHEFVDLMYRPGDPKVMKKVLDEFTMARKETFVVTPRYNMGKHDNTFKDFEENDIKDEDDSENDELSWDARYRNNININNFHDHTFHTNDSREINMRTDLKHAVNNFNLNLDNVATVNSDGTNTQYDNSAENDPIRHSELMWRLLSKQNELIEKLASRYHEMILEEAKRPKHESFNEILRSAKMKRLLRQSSNATNTTEKTTTATDVGNSTTTEITTKTTTFPTTTTTIANNATGSENNDPPSTLKTIFDETEIKNALKKDPLVQRILKMANKKREDYFKKIKERKND